MERETNGFVTAQPISSSELEAGAVALIAGNNKLPSSAVKHDLVLLSLGIFCKLGSLEANLLVFNNCIKLE